MKPQVNKPILTGRITIYSKFIFQGNDEHGNPKSELYHQIGRSFATAISDDIFREVAYIAKNKDDILHGENREIRE